MPPDRVCQAAFFVFLHAQIPVHHPRRNYIHHSGVGQGDPCADQQDGFDAHARAELVLDPAQQDGQEDKEQEGKEAVHLFAVQQGGRDDVCQEGDGHRGQPGGQHFHHQAQDALGVQLDLVVDHSDEVLEKLPQLFQRAQLAEQQRHVQQAQQEKEPAGQRQGEAVFQQLCPQDLEAVSRRHVQHVTLFGIHVPVQGQHALHPDQHGAAHGDEEQQQAGQADEAVVFLVQEQGDQEGQLRHRGDAQDDQLQRPGFLELVFQQFTHCMKPPYARRSRGSGPPSTHDRLPASPPGS